MSLRHRSRAVLAVGEGNACGLAGCDGQLARDEYKGDDALVCTECGVPAVRVW
jgi:hypothetical protein